MSSSLSLPTWPLEDTALALVALARAAGIPCASTAVDKPAPEVVDTPTLFDQWLEAASAAMQLEVSALRVPYAGVEAALCTPTLVRFGGELVAIASVRRGHARCVSRSGAVERVPVQAICAELRAAVDPTACRRVDAFLERADVRAERRGRARDALLLEHLALEPVDVGWSVAIPHGARLSVQLRDAGIPLLVARIAVAQLLLQLLSICGWVIVGRSALQGRFETESLLVWALLLTSIVPVRLLVLRTQGHGALRIAVLLKRRLLCGALRLHPDESRHQGIGTFLGRTLESAALESFVTSGAAVALAAAIEISIAAVVLACGAGGWWSLGCLAAWMLLTVLVVWSYARELRQWSTERVVMTNDLVERMLGHRTRLAQQPRERWHDEEDQELARYTERSARVDRAAVRVVGLVPRGWLLLGLIPVASGFAQGGQSAGALAAWIGGVLLAYRGLAKLTAWITALLGARVAWKHAAPLIDAAARNEAGDATTLARGPADGPLLSMRDVTFRHSSRSEPIVSGTNLRVEQGERLLLQGGSGCGKSTLAAIVSGLRVPQSGELSLRGVDFRAVGGEAWRRRVVAAPQFHENYVVTGSLAFNLLMGRTWPPRAGDLQEAMAVCRELGLDDLLQRMPAGLLQVVGETGWRLSHGERSRIFIARALLQRADMVVLDETFASLDPQTLDRALRCVLARAPALLVIAHP